VKAGKSCDDPWHGPELDPWASALSRQTRKKIAVIHSACGKGKKWRKMLLKRSFRAWHAISRDARSNLGAVGLDQKDKSLAAISLLAPSTCFPTAPTSEPESVDNVLRMTLDDFLDGDFGGYLSEQNVIIGTRGSVASLPASQSGARGAASGVADKSLAVVSLLAPSVATFSFAVAEENKSLAGNSLSASFTSDVGLADKSLAVISMLAPPSSTGFIDMLEDKSLSNVSVLAPSSRDVCGRTVISMAPSAASLACDPPVTPTTSGDCVHENPECDEDPAAHFVWTLPSTGIDRDKTELWLKKHGSGSNARNQWMLAQTKAGLSGEALLMKDINTLFLLTRYGWLSCTMPDANPEHAEQTWVDKNGHNIEVLEKDMFEAFGSGVDNYFNAKCSNDGMMHLTQALGDLILNS